MALELIAELEAGRDLDARVCQMLGIAPRVTWEVLRPDETASAYTADSKADAEKFLSETLAQFPHSWLRDYHVGAWRHYPRVSQDISAAMLVQDALDRRGYWMRLQSPFGQSDTPGVRDWWCGFMPHRMGPDYFVRAETAPLAICRAALVALLNIRGENTLAATLVDAPRTDADRLDWLDARLGVMDRRISDEIFGDSNWQDIRDAIDAAMTKEGKE